MRHDRLSDHFGREPYLHAMEAACGRGLLPRPRTGTFARAGKTQDQVRTAARLRRFWQHCMGGCGAMTCGRRPIQEMRTEKARRRFPGAGF